MRSMLIGRIMVTNGVRSLVGKQMNVELIRENPLTKQIYFDLWTTVHVKLGICLSPLKKV